MATVPPEQLIGQIHAAGARIVIAVTGGGSGAIAALLGVPGASRSVLAAVVPYAESALTEWLGGRPDEFCAPRTARSMAMAAFQKARQYDPRASACGIACTASLASDRLKRGPHRAHLAYQTATTTGAVSVELAKGTRTRAEEEALVTALVLNLIAEAAGLPDRVATPLISCEHVETAVVVGPPDQQALLADREQAVGVLAAEGTARPRAVFPGAFNPLHCGHVHMADAARQILGQEVEFELSISNVDKPPLDFIEIDRRVRQFSPSDQVWLTRAPLFTEKADLFPGATFVVGADTIARVGQARYYGGHDAAMQAAIAQITAAGCGFLVFGRMIDGSYRTLADLEIPKSLARICRAVPESAFREDISSTELRQGLVD